LLLFSTDTALAVRRDVARGPQDTLAKMLADNALDTLPRLRGWRTLHGRSKETVP
jgi:hypothetical protein